MRSSPLALASVLALSLLAPACSKEPPQASPGAGSPPPPAAAAATGLPDRDPALAHKLVAAGGVLIDVRTPEEYATRHIDGAVNIPVDALKDRLGDVDKLTGGEKGKPIVVYCQAGGRAGRAKTILVEAGHPQVENLGGIADWDRK
jgi:phage shock protein E